MKRRALISVTNKDALAELAKALIQSNYEIVATTGTAKSLKGLGLPVTAIEEVTGVEELAGGRVKSLHPNIFAGILVDRDSNSEMEQLERSHIAPIDVVVVNLYDFASNPKSDEIDIGGSALMRAAAKNHRFVTLLTHPKFYQEFIDSLPLGISDQRREELAGIAFATSLRYEMEIARHLAPSLRYGENPHQKGALVAFSGDNSGAKRVDRNTQKALSYNNLLDADAAWRAVLDHEGNSCAIIKHGNPCGIASADSALVAFKKALESDPVSSFGGVVALNGTVDEDLAKDLSEIFLEVIIAPAFTPRSIEVLSNKRELRLLEVERSKPTFTGHLISGGLLLQEMDDVQSDPSEWELVAGNALSDEMMKELHFTWRCVRSVKSNAIVIAKNQATVGIGMGQVSRVDAARLAVSHAGDRARGAFAASDGFFPFADGAVELARAGVSAIVQPGGSKRDNEVMEVVASMGVTMYFTGRRHFSH
ncbi:MAG: bifunctional phosphoribosylaminoimidazolecarboxamide formyltransferase/IMP cyclohydrolase [Actinomycetota bacterium]